MEIYDENEFMFSSLKLYHPSHHPSHVVAEVPG
jgi:hypothetical protein